MSGFGEAELFEVTSEKGARGSAGEVLAMDFDSQDVARRKSFLLLTYFVLALLAMILALYVVVLIALGQAGHRAFDARRRRDVVAPEGSRRGGGG